MADLISPGVDVQITDESISTASTPGTVPLFVLATAQDKLVPGSTSIASATTQANANTLQLVTSQKNVLDLFGTPVFQVDSTGSVVQGDELNEYGLHAVYSYMGISNRAYVVRADLDLAQLSPRSTAPTGPVSNGTLWLDMTSSQVEAYIAKVENPSSFHDWELKTVHMVTAEDVDDVDTTEYNIDDLVLRFKPSNGQFLMYKLEVQGLVQPNTILSLINKVPTGANISVGDVWIRDGYTQNGSNYFGTRFVIKRYMSLTGVWTVVPTYTGNNFAEIESKSGVFNTSYIASRFDLDSNSFSFYLQSGKTVSQNSPAVPVGELTPTTATQISYLTFSYLDKVTKLVAVKQGETINTATIISNISSSKDMANAGFSFVRDSNGALVVSNKNGYSFKTTQTGDVLFSNTEFAKLSVVESSNYSILNPNNFKGNTDTPTSIAKDGTYWYDFSNSDNLTVTMYTADYATDSWKLVDSSNQYVQVDEPTADREFWVLPLSQGVDGYVFHRNINGSWVKLDTTDQSTLNGMIFEDFNFPDTVPAPELYQNSMLAIDMGNTEGVVKKMEDGEWHVVSGTNLSGSGLFGRAAQRQIVVQALQAVLVGNEDIRSEWISYNLICVPGYVETLDECVTLNVDRKETAFIITDVPARLDPTGNGNDVQAWASNANNAASNGDVGRTTTYDYAAEYMGWCLSTNVDGTEIAVPGSTIAMRTIAYSDSISHVWNPPAGTSNGVVTNASSVGFINSEGEYQSVQYSEGQRDVMYSNNINPIAMRPTRGLLIWGQKTLSADSTSALSRVNVARLMCYIRKQVAIIAEPFLFRLNTPSTRQEFTGVMNAFFSELVQNNALYDFTVVCDESNNTSARIDRNELWCDIAVQPVRAIEFIYIPIRIENTQ